MKNELIKADEYAICTSETLRKALRKAVHENPAAGMLLEGMITRANELQREINRLASML